MFQKRKRLPLLVIPPRLVPSLITCNRDTAFTEWSSKLSVNDAVDTLTTVGLVSLTRYTPYLGRRDRETCDLQLRQKRFTRMHSFIHSFIHALILRSLGQP